MFRIFKSFVILFLFFLLTSCTQTTQAEEVISEIIETELTLTSTNTPILTNTIQPLPISSATQIPVYTFPLLPGEVLPSSPIKIGDASYSDLQLLRIIRVPGKIGQLMFSQDNKEINISSRSDKPFDISFNISDGKENISTHDFSGDFSPDSKWQVNGDDGFLEVYQSSSSQRVLSIKKQASYGINVINNWGFSNDSRLFWYKYGNVISFYNTADWSDVTELNCPKCWYTKMLPGNEVAAYAGAGLYSIRTGEKTTDYFGVEESESAYLSNSGKYLVLISKNNKNYERWNISTHVLENQNSLNLSAGQNFLDLLPNDQGYIISDYNGSSFIGRSWTGENLFTFAMPYVGKGGNVKFSPDGTLMAFATRATKWGRNGYPVFWSTPSLSLVYIYGQVERSGKYKVSEKEQSDEVVVLRDIEGVDYYDYKKRSELTLSPENYSKVSKMFGFTIDSANYSPDFHRSDFSKDGTLLAIANGDMGYFSINNLNDQAPLYFYPPDNKQPVGVFILDNDHKIMTVTEGGKDLSKAIFFHELDGQRPGKFLAKFQFEGVEEMIFSGDDNYLVIKHGSKDLGWTTSIIDIQSLQIINELVGSKSPRGERWESFIGSNILIDDHVYSLPDFQSNSQYKVPSQIQKYNFRQLLGFYENYAVRIHTGGSKIGLVEKIDLLTGKSETVFERDDIVRSSLFSNRFLILVCGEDNDGIANGYRPAELKADIVVVDLLSNQSGVLMPFFSKFVINVSPDGKYLLFEDGTLWGFGT